MYDQSVGIFGFVRTLIYILYWFPWIYSCWSWSIYDFCGSYHCDYCGKKICKCKIWNVQGRQTRGCQWCTLHVHHHFFCPAPKVYIKVGFFGWKLSRTSRCAPPLFSPDWRPWKCRNWIPNFIIDLPQILLIRKMKYQIKKCTLKKKFF